LILILYDACILPEKAITVDPIFRHFRPFPHWLKLSQKWSFGAASDDLMLSNKPKSLPISSVIAIFTSVGPPMSNPNREKGIIKRVRIQRSKNRPSA
jgi:hypothetical protein